MHVHNGHTASQYSYVNILYEDLLYYNYPEIFTKSTYGTWQMAYKAFQTVFEWEEINHSQTNEQTLSWHMC